MIGHPQQKTQLDRGGRAGGREGHQASRHIFGKVRLGKVWEREGRCRDTEI